MNYCNLLLLVVKENEQIRLAVRSGQRPDLSVITDGPETLIKLAVGWIKRCWHQNPNKRPAFAGILHKFLCDSKSLTERFLALV